MPGTSPDQEQMLLDFLTDTFRRASERAGAQIFIENADKHGSLVWEAGWEHNGARYFTLAATEYPAGTWHIEIWAAAADDRAYTREITTEHTLHMPSPPEEPTIPPRLDDELWASVAIANSIHPGDPDVMVLPPVDLDGEKEAVSVPTFGPSRPIASDGTPSNRVASTLYSLFPQVPLTSLTRWMQWSDFVNR
jgi:hypothetical protein